MKNAFITILLLLATQTAFANTPVACTVAYEKLLLMVLKDFVSDPNNLLANETSGVLSISSNNKGFIDINSDGSRSEVDILSSYSQIADQEGVLKRRTKYFVRADDKCANLKISSVTDSGNIQIGRSHPVLSHLSFLAINKYLQGQGVIPVNRHSGDHRIKIYKPNLCSDSSASINIVRVHHGLSSLVYTTTYLIEIESGKILQSQTNPGRKLANLCRN